MKKLNIILMFLCCAIFIFSCSKSNGDNRESDVKKESVNDSTLISVTTSHVVVNSIVYRAKFNFAVSMFEKGIQLCEDNKFGDNKKIYYHVGNECTPFMGVLIHLKANTDYYIRPFFKQIEGTTFGKVKHVKTLANKSQITYLGNVTWKFGKELSNDATEEEKTAYKMIKSAMDSAAYYYNVYSTFNKSLTANYVPSVPTADANFSGNIRFGKNTWYMWVGTVMHEIAHTTGAGTHSSWLKLTDQDKGIYIGENGAEIYKELMDSDDSRFPSLCVDKMHSWPYGINQRNEVKDERDLIIHTLINNAMIKDGLGSNL